MGKHSKRDRRRMRQSGLGGGMRVVHRLAKGQERQQLPSAPSLKALGAEVEYRLRCVECARRHGVAAAVAGFGRSRATVYRWVARYHPDDLTSLLPRSRRPKRVRRATWSADQELAVRNLRDRYPRTGKDKLALLLRREGIRLCVSMVGRILASLRRRSLLIEPHAVRVRRPRPVRPHATRVPNDQRRPTHPGQLVQLDTMHLEPLPGTERRQFTAIDVVSRCAVLGVRASATAGTAAAFLNELVDRLPFPVRAIQVDGGSEFMASFEVACQQRGIALYVLPPRSPKRNGRVERLNGTSRREFWECYDGSLELPELQAALREWERQYNTERPHQALGYQTPTQHLAALLSHMS